MIEKIKTVIPELWRVNDPRWERLGQWLADEKAYYMDKIRRMPELYMPELTPYPLLLAEMLGAYLSADDTPDTLRRKAGNAVVYHKSHPIFDVAWKPTLDLIMGQSTRIWKGLWSMQGFTIGEDIIGWGLGVIGGAESDWRDWESGDVLIDLVDAPTPEQIKLIKNQFTQLAPSLMRVWLGNVQALDGEFDSEEFDPDEFETAPVDVFVVADWLNPYGIDFVA